MSNGAQNADVDACTTRYDAMRVRFRLSPKVILLAIVFVAAGSSFVALNFFRELSSVETALFQILTWGTGLMGSYMFAKESARDGARNVLRPHARAAFRRVLALYTSLYRLYEKLEELKEEGPDHRIELLQALVSEHISTGQDAMEDWRDIVPEEVAEIERRNKGR